MSYSVLAAFYNQLQEADYDGIGAYYHKLLAGSNVPCPAGSPKILLDLACGTGILTRRFADLNYDVIGADISPEMLSVASEQPHGRIQYCCQDMTKLDLFGTVDACICTLDALNHLPNEKALKETFSRVSLFMNKGGVFAFDMNTILKHKEILSGNTYVYDLDDIYCIWLNSYCDECDNHRIDITLDIFAKTKSPPQAESPPQAKSPHHAKNFWQKHTERLTERAYPLSAIFEMLTEAGFGDIKAYKWLSDIPADETCEKAVFCAVKL